MFYPTKQCTAITLVKPPRYSSTNNGESAMKVPSPAKRVLGEEAVGIRMVGSLEMFPNIDGTSRKMPVYSRAVLFLAKGGKNSCADETEMGFGLLFIVKSENTSGHEKERVVKSESADATFHDDGDDDDDDDDSVVVVAVRAYSKMSSEEEAEEEPEQETGNQMVNELAAQVNEKPRLMTRQIRPNKMSKGRRKRISAAQRKQMKKGGVRSRRSDENAAGEDVFDPLKSAAAATAATEKER